MSCTLQRIVSLTMPVQGPAYHSNCICMYTVTMTPSSRARNDRQTLPATAAITSGVLYRCTTVLGMFVPAPFDPVTVPVPPVQGCHEDAVDFGLCTLHKFCSRQGRFLWTCFFILDCYSIFTLFVNVFFVYICAANEDLHSYQKNRMS